MEVKLTPPDLSPNTSEELPGTAKGKGFDVAELVLSTGVDSELPSIEREGGFVVITGAAPVVDWEGEEACEVKGDLSELPIPSPDILKGGVGVLESVVVAAVELAGEDMAENWKGDPEDTEPRLNFGKDPKREPLRPDDCPVGVAAAAAVDEGLVACVVVTMGVVKLLGPWPRLAMKLGAMLEPRENVNCGAVPGDAPNGKTGLEAATPAPGAAVEAITGAGFDALSSEASPVAKGFGKEDDAVVALGVKEAEVGGRMSPTLEGLREAGRPPTAKVGGGMAEDTAGVVVRLEL